MDLNILTKDVLLTKNEEKMIKYIVENIDDLEGVTLRKLSQQIYTSPATIVRLSKKLGFKGYLDLYYFISRHSALKMSTSINHLEDDFNFQITSEDYGQGIKEDLKVLHDIIQSHKKQSIVICATGFSGILSQYLYKKFLVRGHRVIYSGGEDSSGIIERNIEEFSLMIGVSKSGETKTIIDKAEHCKRYGVPIFSITGNRDSRLARISDYSLVVKDDNILDTQNLTFNHFFVKLLYLLEIISNF